MIKNKIDFGAGLTIYLIGCYTVYIRPIEHSFYCGMDVFPYDMVAGHALLLGLAGMIFGIFANKEALT